MKVIRTDIVDNGSSFATKAVLYSKDGTRSKGGLIEGVRKDSPMAKEFKDMAFSLQEGEVSQPFETEFGFHLLKVDKIRGLDITIVVSSTNKDHSYELLNKLNFPFMKKEDN